MKKGIIISSLLAIVSVVFVSCQKEVSLPENEQNGELKELHFRVKSKLAPETRTYITNDGNGNYTPYWRNNDQLGALLGTESLKGKNSVDLTLTNTAADGQTGTFEGDGLASGDGTFQAFYPQSAFEKGYDDSGDNKRLVGLNIGDKSDNYKQHPTLSSPDPSCDVLISTTCDYTSDGTDVVIDDLCFGRPLSILKVNLLGTYAAGQEVSWLKVTTSAGILSGRASISLNTGEVIQWNVDKNYAWAEYSDAKPVINNSDKNSVYLVVNPTTLTTGTTLTVTAETAGYDIAKSFELTAPMEFPIGGIAVLNLTVLENDCTAKATVGAALPFNDDMAWADNGASDSNTEISSISESSNGLYVEATKAYKGIGGLKIGSSSSIGSITTKDLDLSGKFYIAVEGAVYGTDTGKLVITVDNDEVLNAAFGTVNYVNIDAGEYTNKSRVTIKTSAKRGRIYSVTIASGVYVAPPVINVTSDNPMDVANTGGSQTIEYSIENSTEATLTAALQNPSDTWISNINYATSGQVSFDVAEQGSGDSARSAVIVLSYEGAEDVEVTINQAAGAGGKTEYKATLEISSGVSSNTTLEDDKGNEWSLSAVAAGWTSISSYVHVGSNTKAATSITLETSAYSGVDIKEIHVWAAAKASSNVTTKISIDGELLGTSEVLGNTISSGGTEFYITNSTNESGDITVVISRPSSANGAIYFKKLEVIYED